MLQLRDKVRSLRPLRAVSPAPPPDSGSEAVSALVNLGYKPVEAERAVKAAQEGGATPLPELIRAALRRLAS